MATFTVTNTNSYGPGSLQQAIRNSNSSPDLDTIVFDIPGTGPHTINLISILTISSPTIIDGTSQPGFSGKPIVAIDGSLISESVSPRFALILDRGSDGSKIQGLAIAGTNGGHSGGIFIRSDNNTIAGNFIGTDITGTDVLETTIGVHIESASHNTIGGHTAADRNIISGCLFGVLVQSFSSSPASHNQVLGNYVGTDFTGKVPLGNFTGIRINNHAPENIVSGNVISGNRTGISIEGGTASNNLVQGNFIGTDAAGIVDIDGGDSGVEIINAPYNTVGGIHLGARNVISDRISVGVFIAGALAGGNKVVGNHIGANVTDRIDFDNSRHVIHMKGSTAKNNIGRIQSGVSNIISGNGRADVYLLSGIGYIA